MFSVAVSPQSPTVRCDVHPVKITRTSTDCVPCFLRIGCDLANQAPEQSKTATSLPVIRLAKNTVILARGDRTLTAGQGFRKRTTRCVEVQAIPEEWVS